MPHATRHFQNRLLTLLSEDPPPKAKEAFDDSAGKAMDRDIPLQGTGQAVDIRQDGGPCQRSLMAVALVVTLGDGYRSKNH